MSQVEPLGKQPNPKISDSIFECFKMTGKVVAISGGGGGIGYEVARAMAEAGANVAIWYHSNEKTIDKAKDLEREYGIKAKAYKCQVGDSQQVWDVIGAIVKEFGRLDVMIANAGIPAKAGALDQPLDDWKKVMDTDFNGAYYCAKAAGEVFKKQGSGNLIFTGSMSGHIVNVPQLQSSYNAAKAGVIHLAKSLAVEYCGFARVNCVSPGYIHTEMSEFIDDKTQSKFWEYTPMGRDAMPKELKGAYLYFASDASSFCTGSDLVVDGGYTIR